MKIGQTCNAKKLQRCEKIMRNEKALWAKPSEEYKRRYKIHHETRISFLRFYNLLSHERKSSYIAINEGEKSSLEDNFKCTYRK